MIALKDAVKVAMNHFRAVFPASYREVTLEEIELSPDEAYWLVTLGFTRDSKGSIRAMTGNPLREYKIVSVDTETGAPVSVKIRKP